PGNLANKVDDIWLERQLRTFDELSRVNTDGMKLVATVALEGDVVRDDEQVHRILDASAEWPVDGVYLVCEHPKGEYLVSDATWVANVLDLAAGFRLQGRRVILGYCNHQMLIASCASVNAIASGTWMNVRSFPPDKFR